MLNCEELLEKLSENPNIEPWFKESLSALIPKGFKAVAEMFGEKKTQEILEKTAWIVENSTMCFDDLNKNSENAKISTEGTWNGGFIKHEGQSLFTGDVKRKNGLPNFVGELKIDKNSETKVQALIHEFFGHLIVQVIEPEKIGDKRYAIDGFYMDEISEKGEKTRTNNRLIAEGFSELVSEKVAKECGIPYQISNSYLNGYLAAKMLCQVTNNRALLHNLEGMPHKLEQDMNKAIGGDSWRELAYLLDCDYVYKKMSPDDYNPEKYLNDAQDTLSSFFIKGSNFSNSSISDFCTKIRNFETTSFFSSYKLGGKEKELLATKYIDANLGNEYSSSEKIKHCFAFNNTFNSFYNIQGEFNKDLMSLIDDVINNRISKDKLIDSASVIQENRKAKEDTVLDTSVSFSEDISNEPFNESIMFLKSSSGTKISFLRFANNDNNINYLYNIYNSSEIDLSELTNKDLAGHDKFIKQKLYEEYSKDGKVKKIFKTKANKIKEADIPESYIFSPGNSRSIYIISKLGGNEYDVHHMERFSGKSFRKLNMSQSQKVGENVQKRDMSFICPKTKEGKVELTPKSIRDSVSQEAALTK